MTNTNTKDIQEARNELAAILDDKFKNVPEWRAFRAMERALAAMRTNGAEPATQSELDLNAKRITPLAPPRKRRQRLIPSYTTLADQALTQAARPVTTPELVAYIGQQRTIDPDVAKAKINITSALSKDERFLSVPWRGAKAWWYADREVPKP